MGGASAVSFALAMLVLAATPGPGVFAVTAHAAAYGFRSSLWVILGIIAGDCVFMLLALHGLAYVAETFYALFTVIRILGGLYLVYLGLKALFARSGGAGEAEVFAPRKMSAFTGGLFLTLSNPKVILFYIGFLPTFMDLHALTTADTAIALAVIAFVLGSVLAVYAGMTVRARKLFGGSLLNRCAGVVMLATGAVLLGKRS